MTSFPGCMYYIYCIYVYIYSTAWPNRVMFSIPYVHNFQFRSMECARNRSITCVHRSSVHNTCANDSLNPIRLQLPPLQRWLGWVGLGGLTTFWGYCWAKFVRAIYSIKAVKSTYKEYRTRYWPWDGEPAKCPQALFREWDLLLIQQVAGKIKRLMTYRWWSYIFIPRVSKSLLNKRMHRRHMDKSLFNLRVAWHSPCLWRARHRFHHQGHDNHCNRLTSKEKGRRSYLTWTRGKRSEGHRWSAKSWSVRWSQE